MDVILAQARKRQTICNEKHEFLGSAKSSIKKERLCAKGPRSDDVASPHISKSSGIPSDFFTISEKYQCSEANRLEKQAIPHEGGTCESCSIPARAKSSGKPSDSIAK